MRERAGVRGLRTAFPRSDRNAAMNPLVMSAQAAIQFSDQIGERTESRTPLVIPAQAGILFSSQIEERTGFQPTLE
jgi:hypothetical protein